MNITTTTTKNCKIYKHDACNPVTTTTQKCCVECIHPIEYLFDYAFNKYKVTDNNFAETVLNILDKGFIFYDCDICCTSCKTEYIFANIETWLKYADAKGWTVTGIPPSLPNTTNVSNEGDIEKCCLTINGTVDEFLKFAEDVGYVDLGQGALSEFPFLTDCCNNFNECFNDLLCWVGLTNGYEILNSGIIEYGQIYNNCNNNFPSGLCVLLKTLKKYEELVPNLFLSNNQKFQFVLRFLEKGIGYNCFANFQNAIASVETYLKYAELYDLTAPAPEA
jgi:hypothetical protein